MQIADSADSPVVVVREPGRTPLFLILHEPLDVGRDGSGLMLDDPGVSRRHLRLRAEGGELVVEDLGSSNGTFLDGDRVAGSVILGAGSILRLGDTTIELVAVRIPLSDLDQSKRRTSIEELASEITPEDLARPAVVNPQGTVTIAFTDIESSTSISASMGDERWFELLGLHNGLVRENVRAHGGVEIKARGDGFMLAFDSAYKALRAMIAAQRAIETGLGHGHPEIRIRVGAHTGEAFVDHSGDMIGYHVNVAARIGDQARGGEILVSSLLKEIVNPRGEFHFGEPRMVELRGLGNHLLHPVLWSKE